VFVPEESVVHALPQWLILIALLVLTFHYALSLQAVSNITRLTEEERISFGKYLIQLFQYSLLKSLFIFYYAAFYHRGLHLQKHRARKLHEISNTGFNGLSSLLEM